MGILHRLLQKSISPSVRARDPRAKLRAHGWHDDKAGPPLGMSSLSPGSPRISPPKPPEPEVRYSLDLDIGEVADGYHLIVRSISLTDESLFFEYVFVPERTEEAEVWPNMNYGADVSPPGWNQACSDAEMYERPVPEARHAWFDFFRPDYDWMGHFDPPGQPDSDYLRNRIARLTFDLKTGEAHIEK